MKLTYYKILLVAGLSTTINAATFNWDNGGVDSNWNTAENWDNSGADGVPGSSDQAVIGNGDTDTASFSSGSSTISGFTLGTGATGDGTLGISGGTFAVTGNSSIAASGAQAVFNLSGGTFSIPSISTYTVGTLGASGESAVFNISGGILNAGVEGTNTLFVNLNGDTTFNITGDSATFGVRDLNLNEGIHNINFIADASGVSEFDLAFLRDTDGTHNLTVDLTNYDVSNGTSLTLIDSQFNGSGNFNASTWDSINVVGGSGDFTYSYAEGAVLSLDNIVIPEPTSSALFGLAGLAFLTRRRRS